MNLPTDKRPHVHSSKAGGFLTAYIINDQTGEMVRKTVLNTRDVNGKEVYQFSPTRILHTNDEEFVVEVYKKKKEDILIKVAHSE